MTKTNRNPPFLGKLKTTAWRTMGARFNASRRLKRRELVANASIAIFALLSVILAIGQRLYSIPPGSALDNYVTALSVSLGLFVIVISLIEGSNLGPQKAELLYRNGEELNAFQRKLELLSDPTLEDDNVTKLEVLDELRDEYEKIKGRCPYNHEPIDNQSFQADHRLSPEFLDDKGTPTMGRGKAFWIRILNFLSPVWYFGALWIVVGALLSAILWVNLGKHPMPETSGTEHAQPSK
jgi:SMODS and SLOG-associating 2TM effector domain family 5